MKPTVSEVVELARQVVEHKQPLVDHWRDLWELYRIPVKDGDGMTHDTFLCPPHVQGCGCDPRNECVCNPYCVLDYCPTDGEGDACTADPDSLVRVQVGGGFTLALRE